MSNVSVEHKLRRFLLGVVAVILIGSAFELILVEHFDRTLQWSPFLFSGVGFLAAAGVWFRPKRLTLLILRWVMALIALGSLVGVWLHFSGNLAFEQEINPSKSLAESIWPAIKGGNPLMAPGVYFLAGILGLAVTWRHPELE